MKSTLIRVAIVGVAGLTVTGCTIPAVFLPEPYQAPAAAPAPVAAPAPAPVTTAATTTPEPEPTASRWAHTPRGADSPFADGGSGPDFGGLGDSGWN